MNTNSARKSATWRRLMSTTAGALVLFALGPGTVWGSGEPVTPWGHPNLDGLWDFRTITPFQRPEQLGDKAVLTPEEAQAFRALVLHAFSASQ